MADTGIFATTLEVQYKAGANASSVSNTEAYINSYMAQAESYINVATKYNWSDAYSGLNTDVKKILTECASSLAAIYVINYDLSGFSLLNEAITRINVLWARVDVLIALLTKEAKDIQAWIVKQS